MKTGISKNRRKNNEFAMRPPPNSLRIRKVAEFGFKKIARNSMSSSIYVPHSRKIF